ncbi:MAG: sensor histidine kinase, partial [Flavisolibacter sp.]
DIIWVLNPKNDSLENLCLYIREYAVKFFESSDTRVEFEFPQPMPSMKLSEEQRRNIFLVIKETLNNTAKHAHSTLVKISVILFAHGLLIRIEDNGKGFEYSEVRPFANGLSNMKGRMEQVGGEFRLHSEPGKRTVTELELPSNIFV